MKLFLLLPLALLPLVPAPARSAGEDPAPAASSTDGATLRWYDDVDEATLVAAEGDRPLMVVFR